MVSVCLPSDALLPQLPSYLGFSYLGCGVSLNGCSSKAQPLLLTLEEGYLLTAAIPDLQLLWAGITQKKWNSHHGQQKSPNAVLGCNLKNDRMISIGLQGKPFNITVIQVYAPTSNAEETEVERFYEHL